MKSDQLSPADEFGGTSVVFRRRHCRSICNKHLDHVASCCHLHLLTEPLSYPFSERLNALRRALALMNARPVARPESAAAQRRAPDQPALSHIGGFAGD